MDVDADPAALADYEAINDREIPAAVGGLAEVASAVSNAAEASTEMMESDEFWARPRRVLLKVVAAEWDKQIIFAKPTAYTSKDGQP